MDITKCHMFTSVRSITLIMGPEGSRLQLLTPDEMSAMLPEEAEFALSPR